MKWDSKTDEVEQRNFIADRNIVMVTKITDVPGTIEGGNHLIKVYQKRAF
ncbi:MAG: hypothetical protein SVM80_01860 [Halobacteriota archaeon]|nr:hypothetical protein [Halobacteriota archaeon]